MAIRIRCQECRKKLSIDDGFAGSMCRCPYCKAIVPVAPMLSGSAAPRPQAPAMRPQAAAPDLERPMEPPAQPQEQARAPVATEVPYAHAVKVQGLVAMILLGLLLAAAAAATILAYLYMGGRQISAPAPRHEAAQPPSQTLPQGPAVLDVEIRTPVIYCLDAGSSMDQTLDLAAAVTSVSVASLGSEDRFNIVLCRDGQAWLAEQFQPGGPQAATQASRFLQGVVADGAADVLAAMDAAVEKQPRTIVLFARKPLGETTAVLAKAARGEVRIVTLALDADGEAAASLERLAAASGGASRAVTSSWLQDWLRQVSPQ